MGYANGDAIGTLLKVIATNIGKATRAYTGTLSKNPQMAKLARERMKMPLETVANAIASILKKL